MNSALTQSFRSYQQNNCRYNNSSSIGYSYSSQQKMTKKLPALPEEISSKEKGSEAEQQQILQELKNVSKPELNKFAAGNLKIFYLNWKSITNDEIILDIIKNGLKIDFKERPRNICIPKIQHSIKEKEIMNSDIQKNY